jgi:hypothetical protein
MDFLFVVPIGILTLFYLIVEIRASQKRRILNKYINIAQSDVSTGQNMAEASAMGIGGMGMSVYDIYAAADDHEAVLNAIEYRYPHIMGDANSFEWFEKLKSLEARGPKSLENYVYAYKGQFGEDRAIEFYQSQGIDARPFESRGHPDDDIIVTFSDGSEKIVSVKNLKTISGLKSEITKHPNSTNYMINSDLYDKMDERGLIQEYAEKGIEIVPGPYTNAESTAAAEEAFGDVIGAGDISDDIPFIGAAIFGVKTVKNIKEAYKGKQSLNELGINVSGDLFRVAGATTGAVLFTKLGASAGTLIIPGIGTKVGGGIGAILGAIGFGAFVNWAKEKLKWGNIVKALDHFGTKIPMRFNDKIRNQIENEILLLPEAEKEYRCERGLLEKYKKNLNPYSRLKPNLSAILSHIHNIRTTRHIKNIKKVAGMTEDDIIQLCAKAGVKANKNNPEKYMKRFWAEFILSQDFNVVDSLTDDEELILTRYKKQKHKSPNHPYRFPKEPTEILSGLSVKNMLGLENNDKLKFGFNWILFLLMASLVFLWLYFWNIGILHIIFIT